MNYLKKVDDDNVTEIIKSGQYVVYDDFNITVIRHTEDFDKAKITKENKWVRKVMSEELDTLQKVVDNWKENDEIPKFFEDLYSKVKTTDNPVIKKEYMEDLKRMVKFLRKAIREKVWVRKIKTILFM